MWPSKKFLSPRKCYTGWSRCYFPHKRPPQNVWPSRIFLSPRIIHHQSSRANLSPEKLHCSLVNWLFLQKPVKIQKNKCNEKEKLLCWLRYNCKLMHEELNYHFWDAAFVVICTPFHFSTYVSEIENWKIEGLYQKGMSAWLDFTAKRFLPFPNACA